MALSSLIRKSLQGGAKRYGYQIERSYEMGRFRLDILSLVVDRCNPHDPEFFFVQVGANDGESNDQINQMIRQYHWRGVLLEPQPRVFEQLTHHYKLEKQLSFENAALAAVDGKTSFWTVPGQSGLGSFSKEVIYRSGFNDSDMKEVEVSTISISSLLAKHSINKIDLLQIDTEGFDYEVVKFFLATNIRPKIINYEHLHLSTADRTACIELLGGLGYKMIQAGPERIDTVAFLQLPQTDVT